MPLHKSYSYASEISEREEAQKANEEYMQRKWDTEVETRDYRGRNSDVVPQSAIQKYKKMQIAQK